MKSEDKDELLNDRWNIVYMCFFLAGCGALLPWNLYVTSIQYFDHKLKNETLPESLQDDPCYKTDDQKGFPGHLSICAFIPFLIFNVLNLFISRRISLFIIFITGGAIIFVCFFVTAILVYIDIKAKEFFVITLLSIAVINASSAFFQSSLLGIAMTLPIRIVRSTMEGQAVAGILAAVLKLITLAASSSSSGEAFLFFLVALVFLAVAIIAILLVRKNAYFKYYWSQRIKAGKLEDGHQVEDTRFHGTLAKVRAEMLTVLKTMREVVLPGVCILLTFNVTLACYPSLVATIQPTSGGSEIWQKKYFVPVVVFLSFNVCDYIGRFLAGQFKWPRENRLWILIVACIARYALIPLFMFLNQSPKGIPAIFKADVYPVIFIILLGLSNGYAITLAFMHGPSFASPSNKSVAGVALVLYTSMGLASGVAVGAGLLQILVGNQCST